MFSSWSWAWTILSMGVSSFGNRENIFWSDCVPRLAVLGRVKMFYVRYAWSWVPVIFWYFQGVATVAIAYFAVRIGGGQKKTNDLRSKLDLFDRRLRIYEEAKNILGLMYTTGAKDEQLLEFVTKTEDAVFLFGDNIKEYLEEVYRRAQELSFVTQEMSRALSVGASVEERTRLAGARKEDVEWATGQRRALSGRFKKYLDVSKL